MKLNNVCYAAPVQDISSSMISNIVQSLIKQQNSQSADKNNDGTQSKSDNSIDTFLKSLVPSSDVEFGNLNEEMVSTYTMHMTKLCLHRLVKKIQNEIYNFIFYFFLIIHNRVTQRNAILLFKQTP